MKSNELKNPLSRITSSKNPLKRLALRAIKRLNKER